MQFAYERARVGTRAAQWINPKKDELLIPDRKTAYALIEKFDVQLQAKLPRHKRAEILIAKSMIYEALGDQKMMQAAEEAFKVTKTSTTAHMMAVAHHHFGRLQEACNFYTLAYRFPHEEGFNVDLAYTQALLFQGRWSEAHRMTLGLKKRMVYAAYLPEWDSRPCMALSIVSEGGFGDIIQCGRWIPIIREMVANVTVYLPPYFFETGFVDLMRKQSWCPEVKLLTDCPQNVPAVGFFDLPAIFDVQPDNIPPSLSFKADPIRVAKYRDIRNSRFPNANLPTVGFCFAARQQETPLVPDGTYRALTEQQAERILVAGFEKVRFVNLQKDLKIDQFAAPLIARPEINSWEDTCAIIENLDFVISVDTAVFHLAAAMGKPVILILSGASDWKFGLNDETCRWYSNVRIIRNNGFGFENAVEKVIQLVENAQFHNPTVENHAIR
jgi:hypothetical protein